MQLRKACAGGYHYRKLKLVGEDRWESTPNKNAFSHVADALQYLMLGVGVGKEIIKKPASMTANRPKGYDTNYDPYNYRQ